MKKILILTVTLLLVFSLFSCSASKKHNGKLCVVATIFPQYDFARAIGGEKADVVMLLPPGTDSHSFDPSMKDASKIRNADIFVYTGEFMENWAVSFANNAPSDCVLVDLSKNIELIKVSDGHGYGKNVDPHIWTSPKNALIMMNDILEAMCEKDPQNEEYYRQNAALYMEKLSKLDSDIVACVNSSSKKKIYFGGEFALRYFAEDYGIECMTLYDTCSEWSEPDPKAVSGMVEDMKKTNAGIVFSPELSDTKSAKNIADQAGAQVRIFHSCHNLSNKELDEGKTYISLMYENLSSLKEALS